MYRHIYRCITCIFMSSACFAQQIHPHDIIIDEILADPSPAIGLPPGEFVELKNNSSQIISLHNWKFANNNHTVAIKASQDIEPGAYLVLCAMADTASFQSYGTTLGISGFPSLNNSSDTLTLYSPEGVIIDAVTYEVSWYGDPVKAQGGWSLEMIDTNIPCAGAANWKASVNNAGGTPGQKNSVAAVNNDLPPPGLVRSFTLDSSNIVVVFDQPMDSAGVTDIGHYEMNEGMNHPSLATAQAPLFNEVLLHFASAMLPRKTYELTVSGIANCSGQPIGAINQTKAGLPGKDIGAGELVTNEILFNPAPGGFDYIEFYNRSMEIIDCSDLYVARRDATRQLTSLARLSNTPWLLFPGDYLVMTENKTWLQQNYTILNLPAIREYGSLPSLPDDEGTVVLVAGNGVVIDELHYNHKWHFQLLNNEQGVALERISYAQPTQSRDNWTSAAATAGYGTPGYQNSESMVDGAAFPGIAINPKVFSPDHDGHDDFCEIHFAETTPDQTASITLFDASGRRVRYLARNVTLSASGRFLWDGLDDNSRALPSGIYIVFIELFDLKGNTQRIKKTVVLAKTI